MSVWPLKNCMETLSHQSHYYLFNTFTHEVQITTDFTDRKVHFSNESLSLKPVNLINRFLHYIRNRH